MITEKQFKLGFLFLFLCIVATLYFTRNVPDGKPEVTDTFNKLIEDGEFPCSQLADSVYGIDSRGTDSWCELAYCDGNNHYNNKGERIYDYHIDIYNDTVWLYNEEGVILVRGQFDSLTKYIEYDNL